MSLIVHLSDLHFGRDVPVIMETLLENLQTLHPDLIVISGDLTQRATARQFLAARAFLNKLQHPYLVIPGNHDISAHHLPERFFFPWKKWRKFIDHELEPVVQGNGFIALGVNTTRRMGWYLDWSRGRISPEQSSGVREKLKTAPDFLIRIIAVHHPFWLPHSHRSRNLVGGRETALNFFKTAGVDLILGGHIHLAFIHLVQGMIVSHAGTAISSRQIANQPNSYNIIHGDCTVLHLKKMEWKGKNFNMSNERVFRRQEDSWKSWTSSHNCPNVNGKSLSK
jgi:3',5'-cyclic AMP phosphodiesterase CpdA